MEGAMLGSKIDQNSIQEGIEKRMRKRRRLGGVLEASWGPKNPPQEPDAGAVVDTHPPSEGISEFYQIYLKGIIKERR